MDEKCMLGKTGVFLESFIGRANVRIDMHQAKAGELRFS